MGVKNENNIMPGATPKLTISPKESNSFPSSEWACNSLATNPSAKSKTAASNRKKTAVVYS